MPGNTAKVVYVNVTNGSSATVTATLVDKRDRFPEAPRPSGRTPSRWGVPRPPEEPPRPCPPHTMSAERSTTASSCPPPTAYSTAPHRS